MFQNFRSYKFDFEGDDFSRNEESDSTGQIMGNYRFVDSDGQVKNSGVID